jgi:hypothetical protein
MMLRLVVGEGSKGRRVEEKVVVPLWISESRLYFVKRVCPA